MVNFYNTILVHPLLNLLVFFYNYIPDIGIVIIVVTIIVRLLLFPLFHKTIKHQKAMTDLQPKMNEIREKYKDDRERQAKAMMELYKVHKVNPLSSCLPLLIQLPIFFAIYTVFRQSLNGQALQGIYDFIQVPEHINTVFLSLIDLSKPYIPLAIVSGILQYVQGRMQQSKIQSNDPTAKIMNMQILYVLPAVTVFIGIALPAGLTLYWLVTILFGMGQHYYIMRKEAKQLLEENQMDNQVNEKIKQRILELLQRMGFDAEIHERVEEGRIVFNIRTRDAQLLIGKQGSTLESLQHIIRILCRKDQIADAFSFALDIDDYKDKRVLYLKDLARKAAHQVRETKRPVSLVPMPAYERRVIHNYLSLYNDIGSESMGRDPDRKIVIRPVKAKPKSKDDFNFIENS